MHSIASLNSKEPSEALYTEIIARDISILYSNSENTSVACHVEYVVECNCVINVADGFYVLEDKSRNN